MTPKQILDSFSQTLIQDDRILSAPERALLSNLLQHARTGTGEDPKTQEAVRTVIAAAVGETVAQRAFTVLGHSVLERILESSPFAGRDAKTDQFKINAREPQPPGPREPQPPGTPVVEPPPPGTLPTEPQPPGPREPQPPGPRESPGIAVPQRPRRDIQPLEPQPPGHGVTTKIVAQTNVAMASVEVAKRPAVLPAKCVVLDEFLAPQELEELMRSVLEREADFSVSEVLSPSANGGVINHEHRRSRVLMDLAEHEMLMLARIEAVLPEVLEKLGMQDCSIASVEAQVTASNDGDFFHFHSDNGSDRVASRYLTFVYFFHREPRAFEGGELRIHDARLEDGRYLSEGSYQTLVSRQNQIVFFPCELMHEITEVNCPSRAFADSRFTLNGWLRR